MTGVLDNLPGQYSYFYKGGIGSGDLWTAAGSVVGTTPATGAGAIPDRTTAGALPLRNAAAGKQLMLAGLSLGNNTAGGSSANWLLIYDRLWHNSGMGWGTSAAQTINSPTLTRDGGLGAPMMFLTNYSGALANGTAQNVQFSYTNQAGVSGQVTTMSITPINLGQYAYSMIDLLPGDTGFQSVQSMTIPSSPGSGGNLGLVLGRPIALLNAPFARFSAMYAKRDWMSTALAPISNDSCLAFLGQVTTMTGWLQMIEG